MSKPKDSKNGKIHLDKHILTTFGMAKVFKYVCNDVLIYQIVINGMIQYLATYIGEWIGYR